jgi:hypothetical protein
VRDEMESKSMLTPLVLLKNGNVEKLVVHTDPAGGTSVWMVDKAGKIVKADSNITSKILQLKGSASI